MMTESSLRISCGFDSEQGEIQHEATRWGRVVHELNLKAKNLSSSSFQRNCTAG